MERKEFMQKLEELFEDEPDNNKFNAVLELADAYAENEYEAKKLEEKVKWGKNICAAAGEDTDSLPARVFISIADKLEDSMLENNGDLEYAVVQEALAEYENREE